MSQPNSHRFFTALMIFGAVIFGMVLAGGLDLTEKGDAVDKATGRDAHITITASSGLAEQEIERMVKEAEQHAQEDSVRKQEVEARNAADQAVYSAEKTLKDMEDKIPEGVRKNVEEKAEALRKIKDTGSVEELRQKTQELATAMQAIGERRSFQGPNSSIAQPL